MVYMDSFLLLANVVKNPVYYVLINKFTFYFFFFYHLPLPALCVVSVVLVEPGDGSPGPRLVAQQRPRQSSYTRQQQQQPQHLQRLEYIVHRVHITGTSITFSSLVA